MLSAAAPALLSAAPQLLIPLIGLVIFLARRRRLPSAARGLGLTACVLLILAALGRMGYTFWILTGSARGTSFAATATVSLLVNLALVLVNAIGLALLLAAALAGRKDAAGAGPAPWQNAAYPPPAGAWPPPGSPPSWPPPGSPQAAPLPQGGSQAWGRPSGG